MWQGSLQVRWMFGLLSFPVAAAKPEPKPKPGKQKKRRSRSTRLWRALFDARFRRRVYRFVRSVLVALKPRNVSLRLRLGLDDPAEMGMLWSVVGPLTVLTPASFDISPAFPGPVFDLDCRGRVRIIPARMLGLVTAFALSPATLGAVFRQWRQA
jgi:hypothetical protein